MNNHIPIANKPNGSDHPDLLIIHYNGKSDEGLPYMDDYFALVLGLKGSSICNIDNYCFKLTAKNLYLLKHRKSSIFQDVSKDFQCEIVLFKKDLLTHILLGEPIIHNFVDGNFDEPLFSALNKASYVTIRQLYKRLDQEYRGEKLFRSQMLRLLFIELLLEAARSSAYTPAESWALPSRQRQLVHRYHELIEQHFLYDRTVHAYADRLYVSAKYLSEVVKEQTGLPALQFIHQRIFQEAKYWLRTSGMSIKEVAMKLNFDTGSHFSRFFKHVSGINPTDFQRLALY